MRLTLGLSPNDLPSRRRAGVAAGLIWSVDPVATLAGGSLSWTTGTAAGTGTVTYAAAVYRDGVALAGGPHTSPYDTTGTPGVYHVRVTATDDTTSSARNSNTQNIAPFFTVQPTLDAAVYGIGDAVTVTLGTATGGTPELQTFTLGGVDKSGEIVGGDWDTTGEGEGEISLRAQVVGTGGTTLSNIVTADLYTRPIISAASVVDDTVSLTANIPGQLYWLVDSNATRTSAQVVAGGGTLSGNYALESGANSDVIDFSGAGTFTGYIHFCLVSNTLQSAVVSAEFESTASATAPAQFSTGDWTLTDPATDGDLTVTITTLPSDGGSAITALEYQVGAGAWTSLGGTTTGAYTISGLTNDVAVNVAIRAVNAIGNGTASATKSATPTVASGYTPNLVDNQSTGNYSFASAGGQDSAVLTIAFLVDPATVTGTFNNVILLGRNTVHFQNDNIEFRALNTAAALMIELNSGAVMSVGSLQQVVIFCNTGSGTEAASMYVNGSLVASGTPTAGTMDNTRTTDGIIGSADVQRFGDVFIDRVTTGLTIADFWDAGAPKDLSAVGAPIYLFNGTATAWNAGTNFGSLSPTITVTGTFADV